ncbi:MAG: hypothetical protein ACXW11_05850 [Methylotenera sp.]
MNLLTVNGGSQSIKFALFSRLTPVSGYASAAQVYIIPIDEEQIMASMMCEMLNLKH